MAGDWLKIEKATRRKAETLAIASSLGISRAEAFDLCVGFWEWAEDQTADGVIEGVTVGQLDEIVGRPGFAQALLKVDWLQVRTGSLVVPRFARHMGQSAKKRLLDAERKASVREMSALKADKCPPPSSLLSALSEGNEGAGERGPPPGLSLGALWVFYSARKVGRGQSREDPDDAQAMFAEWMRAHGISEAEIAAEVSRPGRDRTESLGEFRFRWFREKGVEGATNHARITATDGSFEAVQRKTRRVGGPATPQATS